MKKILTILLILASVNSCKNRTIDEKAQKNLQPIWSEYYKEPFDDTKSVRVLVVTNRKSKSAGFGCGNENFGVTIDGVVRLGACKINVPKNHAVGETNLTRDNRQPSADFFKIIEAKPLEQIDFIKEIKDSKRTPLVFVHGFNVRYEEAVLRASQIAYDLKYQGAIILFTWPAGGGDGFIEQTLLNKTYENNSAAAIASVAAFKDFLLSLQKSEIKINLMVHSMGHQIVLPALKELGESKGGKVLINHLILNAPDFGINDFGPIVKNIKKVSDKTTVYCSYNDKAMLASKTFNKNDRLGACTLFEDVDVINVGAIDDSYLGLGHGYYSSRAILSDISQTFLGVEANHRLFIVKSELNGAEKYFLRK